MNERGQGVGLDDPLAKLGRRFREFVEAESVWSSPLYTRLSLGVADDPAVLALAAEATAQPVPNLLFAAVHYLLLRDPAPPLAAFYPSLTPEPDTTGDPYPAFHAFCLAQRDALQGLLTTRLVQTNEVRRCALLLPAFARVARRAPARPLALVEIGPSAGLNLLWDRYGYDYGAGGQVGDPASPVQLRCVLQGDRRPPLLAALPPVAYRTGIDLHPVDVRDPDAVLWLRALIWPEQADRRALLEQAVAVAQHDPPALIAGDALARLPDVLAAVPPDTTLCVFHSFTLNQFSPAGRAQVAAMLATAATRRDLYHIWIEQRVADYPELGFAVLRAGAADEQILARCNAHGQWLAWLADAPG